MHGKDADEFKDLFNYNNNEADDSAFGSHARAAWDNKFQSFLGENVTVVVGNAEEEDPCVVAVRSPVNPSEVVLLSVDMISPSNEASLILPQSRYNAQFFTLGWVEPFELNSQILDKLTGANDESQHSKSSARFALDSLSLLSLSLSLSHSVFLCLPPALILKPY